MFTGIIQQLGTLRSVVPRGTGRQLWITGRFEALELGESIACDGVCLTVEGMEEGAFQVTAGEETLRRTTLGARLPGSRLHLERALRPMDRIGGHIVQGHVDGIGTVVSVRPTSGWVEIRVEAPAELARYFVPKGSVCMDGVSLTVNEVEGAIFSVGIIPHTLGVTRVGALQVGERVNVETDVLARYVERFLGPYAAPTAPGGGGGLTLASLKENGFA